MKHLRNPKIARTVLSVLIIALMNTWVPFKSYAQTTNFSTSGENNPGDGISVNHLTGDFGYNLPVLSIPGIAGGFPINLTYNAGIRVEQEASWIGLGWNFFPGGINRYRKGFPDDWNGKKVQDYFYNRYPVYVQETNHDGDITYSPTNLKQEEQTAFGSLYNAKAWKDIGYHAQNPHYVMDVHENAYNMHFSDDYNNSKSPTVILPSYDDYEVIAPDFGAKISPKIFEFGTLTGDGRVFSNWNKTSSDERMLPKEEILFYNRNRLTDRKVHFYMEGEHGSFGQIKPLSGINYPLNQDVLWGTSFSTIKNNTYGNLVYDELNNRIKTGNFVQWYSNSELYHDIDQLVNNGFVEYEGISRSELKNSDPDGIGAFSITTPDGKTYHYSLPAYQFEEFTFSQYTKDPEREKFKLTNYNKYAYTWLLTAITGPDFVDRGKDGDSKLPNGIIDDSDLGYWVKIDYGKWTDGYPWRTPQIGTEEIPSSYWYNSTGDYSTYSFGIKELYYLNSIKTKSHTAFFIKSLRSDALGNNNTLIGNDFHYGENEQIILPEKHKTLKLEKIILLRNEDAQIINKNNISSQLITTKAGQIKRDGQVHRTFNIYYQNNMIDNHDIESNLSQIESSAVRIVELNQDYTLCNGTPNSSAGKLTLKSVNLYNSGKNKIQPSYKFAYAKNLNYNSSNKDRWGFYSTVPDDRMDKPDSDTWSLSEIELPAGGKVLIKYESDYYGNIECANGYPLWGNTGGGIRVKEIKINEGNYHTYSLYKYKNPITNASSGTTSYRPNAPGFVPYIHELPGPGVMYEYVTVENFGDNDGLLSKTLLKFDVFKFGRQFKVEDMQHTLNYGVHEDKNSDGETLHSYAIRLRTSVLKDQSASIGRPLSETTYNQFDQIVEETIYDYYQPSELKAGIRQETFNNFKRFLDWSIEHRKSNNFFITTVSSKLTYPNVIKRVTKTGNGITVINEFGDKESDFNGFDFFSGSPLITKTITVDKQYKTVSVPAYLKTPYSSMGLKSNSIHNKNMLVQETANYMYVKEGINFTTPPSSSSNDGANDNSEEAMNYAVAKTTNTSTINTEAHELVKATVQTWKNAWNYRGLNTARNQFIENASSTNNIWRPYQSYAWKSIPNVDGTIKTKTGNKQKFEDFDWTGVTIKNNWQLASQSSRFDEYSNALETSDINDLYSSVKTCHNGLYALAKCNANYAEFTFSGAEEAVLNTNFLEGEVNGANYRFNASSNSQYAHTGNYSVRLNSQADGFKYSAEVGTNSNQMQKGKKYKASVWVRSHNSSSAAPAEAALNFKLYSAGSLISNSNVTGSSSHVEKAGNWFLLTMEFEIPSTTTADRIEISASTLSSPVNAVYFDDFRVHPYSTPMVSYVYDTKLGVISAVLDGDNFGLKYMYDSAGILTGEHQEFTDRPDASGGFKKVKENSYNYARGLND